MSHYQEFANSKLEGGDKFPNSKFQNCQKSVWIWIWNEHFEFWNSTSTSTPSPTSIYIFSISQFLISNCNSQFPKIPIFPKIYREGEISLFEIFFHSKCKKNLEFFISFSPNRFWESRISHWENGEFGNWGIGSSNRDDKMIWNQKLIPIIRNPKNQKSQNSQFSSPQSQISNFPFPKFPKFPNFHQVSQFPQFPQKLSNSPNLTNSPNSPISPNSPNSPNLPRESNSGHPKSSNWEFRLFH